MRITHLTSVHSVSDTRIFLKECKTLAKNNYEIILIACSDTSRIKDNIKIIGISQPTSRLTRILGTIWKIYRAAVKSRADIYHLHDPELLPLGLVLKWFYNAKVIYDIHEDVPRAILDKAWITVYLRRPVSFVFEKLENFISKRLDACITATSNIKERFIKVGCNAHGVYNYPLLEEFDFQKSSQTIKKKQVCYVGGITAVRSIHEMVEAIGMLDYQLALGGPFLPPALRDGVVRLSGWAHVNELGKLGRKQLVEVLSESMAGLVLYYPLANHIYAEPNKIFEYMAAGLAIIASDFPMWRDLIEREQCGLVADPLDPKDIARAIRWVMDNPDEIIKMGQCGLKAVKEKYNWEQESIKLLKLYEELLTINTYQLP